MYESYFGLKKRPFIATPSLDRYFPASSIEQTFQIVSRTLERAEGPVSVMGGTGLGKSLLCMRIADAWQKSFDVILLSSSQLCSRRALLQNLLFELRMPYRDLTEGELRLSLMDRLLSTFENPSDGALILVDEAQALPLKLLEELRLITNLVKDGLPRVRLVLIGTMRLDEMLGHPRLESLNQRLAARCYLHPLNADETARFIRHKIEICGANLGSTVTDEAIHQVYRATDGIPRLIDQLMDHALMLAVRRCQRPVGISLVDEAWSELQQLPLPWNQDIEISPKSTTIEFATFEDEAEEFSVHDSIRNEAAETNVAIDEQPCESSLVSETNVIPVFDSGDEVHFVTFEESFGKLPSHDVFKEILPCEHAPSWQTEISTDEWSGNSLSEPMFVFKTSDDATFETTPEPTSVPIATQANNVFGEDFDEEFDLGTPQASFKPLPMTTTEYSAPDVPSFITEDPLGSASELNSASDLNTANTNEFVFTNVDDLESESLEADLRDIISSMNLESMTIDPSIPLLPIEPANGQVPLHWEDYPAVDLQQPEILSFSDLVEMDTTLQGDDRDMLVIEEDLASSQPPATSPWSAVGTRASNPYCELFSKLRR